VIFVFGTHITENFSLAIVARLVTGKLQCLQGTSPQTTKSEFIRLPNGKPRVENENLAGTGRLLTRLGVVDIALSLARRRAMDNVE